MAMTHLASFIVPDHSQQTAFHRCIWREYEPRLFVQKLGSTPSSHQFSCTDRWSHQVSQHWMKYTALLPLLALEISSNSMCTKLEFYCFQICLLVFHPFLAIPYVPICSSSFKWSLTLMLEFPFINNMELQSSPEQYLQAIYYGRKKEWTKSYKISQLQAHGMIPS